MTSTNPSHYRLQHLILFEQYESSSPSQDINQLNTAALNEQPINKISPEAFFYYLHDMYQLSSKDIPNGCGFEQNGAKISLIFGGLPTQTILLAIFTMIQTNLVALHLEGIDKVVLFAGTTNEITYFNVSSLLLPNVTLIPEILSHVQLLHNDSSQDLN